MKINKDEFYSKIELFQDVLVNILLAILVIMFFAFLALSVYVLLDYAGVINHAPTEHIQYRTSPISGSFTN